MEYGSRLRFALFAIAGILLLVLSIWGITALAKHIISGPTTTTKTSTTAAVKQTDLADYAKPETFVRVTVEGPVVANENYRSYQIEIAQDYREVKVFKGYVGTLISDTRYDNNSNAYTNFLKSLKQVSFTASRKTFGPDETGYCATGNRYIYELYDQDGKVFRNWGESCSAEFGTFAGVGPSVRYLFKAQIPDFDTIYDKQQLSI